MAFSPLQTHIEAVSADAVLAALDHILASEGFRKTPSLRHLLQYLVTRSLEGHAEQIKESTIAIDVFSRRDDFDGRIDNIVRVQAHRLRKLLEAYYATTGASEAVRISIPKGSYVPQFETRDELRPAEPVLQILPDPIVDSPRIVISEPAPPPLVRSRLKLWIALAFLAGGGLTAAVFWLLVSPRAAAAREIPAAVRELWSPIFESGTPVIASYSNPAFLRVGHSPMLLLYNGPISAPPGAVIELGPNDPYTKAIPRGAALHFSESWTGTGEVLAIHRLTLLSSQFRHPIAVTPSRLLTLDDVHSANIVFIGSPSVNGSLAQIGLNTKPFYSADKGRIVIRDPRPGEPPSFSNMKNEVTKEVIGTYALFSVLPGIDGRHTVVSSAGLNTTGTWAGIDYVTTSSGASRLVRALKAANGGKLPSHYQAIIRADVIKGAVSNPSLVTVRVIAGS